MKRLITISWSYMIGIVCYCSFIYFLYFNMPPIAKAKSQYERWSVFFITKAFSVPRFF